MAAPSDLAWRLLAQAALQDATARDGLVEQARAVKIPAEAWPGIAATLVSETLQDGVLVAVTDSARGAWSEAEANRRLDLIEALLALTPDPAARHALQTAAAWWLDQVSEPVSR